MQGDDDTEDRTPTDAVETASPKVIAALVDSHREFLRFLERRVGNRAIAEDILQEAFARGLDRLPSLRDNESVVAWFYRILRNAVIDDHRRRQSATNALEAFAAELAHVEQPEPNMRGAVCQCITGLITTLKPEYAEALQRVEVDALPVKSFAVEAGISSQNAAVRLFRARKALRQQVAASCGTCAEHGCLDCTCAKSHGGSPTTDC